MDLLEIRRATNGALRADRLPDGRHRITVATAPGFAGAVTTWTTAYPLALVREIHEVKGPYVCDEIMREEDPRYVERAIRAEVFGYVEPAALAGKRVLDFGCGSGASALVLSRLAPGCEIVGVELQERLARVARMRADYLERPGLSFHASPSGEALPEGLGEFDYVVFSAVFEHLLAGERTSVLPRIWSHLKPGGILFLNQTPHRWSPIEMHTTGLPLINYLPDELAYRMAHRFSHRVHPMDDWPTMLRDGIRGATVGEVMGILARCGRAELVAPMQGDRIDLWYRKLSPRYRPLKRAIWLALKALKPLGGEHLVPELCLAIRKVSAAR